MGFNYNPLMSMKLDKVKGSETDPIVGAVNGIVKADGAGNISAAVADTDYLTPGTAAKTYFKVDQTTPQTVINGTPIFNVGWFSNDDVKLIAGKKIIFDGA